MERILQVLSNIETGYKATNRRLDDGGSMLISNVGRYLPDYMVLHPRIQPSPRQPILGEK
jgi:hypothetical protein